MMLTTFFFCGAIVLGQTPQSSEQVTAPGKTTPQATEKGSVTHAEETLGPVQVVWLQSQNCWGEGQQILGNSPHIGKWRIKRKWIDSQGNQSTYVVTGSGDPSGLIDILNQKRASRGLRPVTYDANAAALAATNNQYQRSLGLGHHVTGGYAQNAVRFGKLLACQQQGMLCVNRDQKQVMIATPKDMIVFQIFLVNKSCHLQPGRIDRHQRRKQ
jgi:uncharacterized protein YkwD